MRPSRRRRWPHALDPALQLRAMISQTDIARQVVESILAQRLKPGERLGEQALADLYGVSRTMVREALMQLQARGFVEVRTRKGWYVVEPSIAEARDAFAARRAVEGGMLRQTEGRPLQAVVRRLRQHIADEQQALDGTDTATRAFLLADFHVCLAESLGHRVLADILRDLTARTTIVATLYQSTHDARASCADHARIVGLLEAGDCAGAERLMLQHIGSVESALGKSLVEQPDAQSRLRATLAPVLKPAANN